MIITEVPLWKFQLVLDIAAKSGVMYFITAEKVGGGLYHVVKQYGGLVVKEQYSDREWLSVQDNLEVRNSCAFYTKLDNIGNVTLYLTVPKETPFPTSIQELMS